MDSQSTLCTLCGYMHQNQDCTVNSTTFNWNHGGKDVFITGNWNQWQVHIQMYQSQEDKMFYTTLQLPQGIYQYKYVVDGQWFFDKTKTTVDDGEGGFNNQIEVQPRAITMDHSEDEEDIEQESQGTFDENQEIKIKLRTNMDAPNLMLIGSWDDWDQWQNMTRKFSHINNAYVHEIKLTLRPGKYEYKFISQDIFMHDPEHKVVQNGYGNYNNIIFVNEKHGAQHFSNKKMDRLIWKSYKVSNEFYFDQMILGHSINFVGNLIYIFGGSRGGQYLNNFYCYNLREQEIEHVQYIGTPPSSRAYHKTVTFGSKILFYGGMDNNHIFNDYFVFNTITKSWTSSDLVGQRPSERERYSLSVYKNIAAILFGGYYCSQDMEVESHYNQLYSLNLQKMCWTELKPQGKLPAPRFSHSSNVYKQYIYVYGGLSSYIKTTVFNDIWRIGLENQELQWENLTYKSTGMIPEGRYGHSSNIINEHIIIFGGRTEARETLNSIILFNLPRSEWVVPKIYGDIPKPRLNHAACQLEKRDGILIFGGNLIFDSNKTLNLRQQGFLFYKLKPEQFLSRNIQKTSVDLNRLQTESTEEERRPKKISHIKKMSQ